MSKDDKKPTQTTDVRRIITFDDINGGSIVIGDKSESVFRILNTLPPPPPMPKKDGKNGNGNS